MIEIIARDETISLFLENNNIKVFQLLGQNVTCLMITQEKNTNYRKNETIYSSYTHNKNKENNALKSIYLNDSSKKNKEISRYRNKIIEKEILWNHRT